MLGFARNIVLFRVNGGFVAEKLARVRDGLRRRRFAESGSICARSVTEEGSRGDFFSSLLVLCPCVSQWSLCRSQWNGCEIFLSSAAEIHKSYCSDCMKVANGALAADFFHFGVDDVPFKIPFKKCLKIIAFPLGRRDPVLELQFV